MEFGKTCFGVMDEPCWNFDKLVEMAKWVKANLVVLSVNGHEVIKQSGLAWEADNVAPTSGGIWGLYPKCVAVLLSEEINCDEEDPLLRRLAEVAMTRDVLRANALGFGGHLMIALRKCNNPILARILSSNLKGNLWVQVQMTNPRCKWIRSMRDTHTKEESEFIDQFDHFNWWKNFQSNASPNNRVGVALVVRSRDIPDRETIQRWLGEPVKALVLPTSLFITNGAEGLSERWQEVLVAFLSLKVNIILNVSMSADVTEEGVKNIFKYLLDFMVSHNYYPQINGSEEKITLQDPQYNLSDVTRISFGHSPYKYQVYEDALCRALMDRVPPGTENPAPVVIYIFSDPSGSLLLTALRAARKSACPTRFCCVEDNNQQMRFITYSYEKLLNKYDVCIFDKNIEETEPEADIFLSEFLGCYGDMDRPYEKLTSFRRLLKPDGVVIPRRVVSKLYLFGTTLGKAAVEVSSNASTNADDAEVLQTSVIMGDPLLFSTFMPDAVASRSAWQKFDLRGPCKLTACALGFEADMYADITLRTKSTSGPTADMTIFPIFLPFQKTLKLEKQKRAKLFIWRQQNNTKAWYKWALNSKHPKYCSDNKNNRRWAVMSHEDSELASADQPKSPTMQEAG